ncbi:hypothetical protein [Halomonas sp. NO4]|uniref:hypothetical protein n=1 Tax=Halomonas sp. NO4 TaxID=2484813 RepID=UPI0013D1737E|nr:hypothetical protein [Halomonas sp. NO4]
MLDRDQQDVIAAAERICGSWEQARHWFHHEALLTFAGQTPQQLVDAGRKEDLLRYLKSLEAGFTG